MRKSPRQADGLNLTREVKARARGLGADLAGVASVERWNDPPPFDASRVRVYPPSGYAPTELMPSTRSVIVVAVRYLDGLMEHLITPCRTTSVQNNFGYVYLNRRLHQATSGLAEWLEDRGQRSLPLGYNIGSRYDVRADEDGGVLGAAYGLFSMKRAAVLAGLGRAARNGLVASPEFGPRIRLGAVLTEAPLVADPLLPGDPCPSSCDICMRVCPTDAIWRDRGVSHLRCFSDAGRRGTRYAELREAFKRRYPSDLPGVDSTANDFLAIDGNDGRICKLACVVACPLGARTLPDVWRSAKGFPRIVPKVQLHGFPPSH